MLRNTLCLLVRCPPTTTLPMWPGSALPGQWPGPWSSVVSLIPSYIAMYTSIAGISIEPTSMTGSTPFSSSGGAIGWGRTTGMVVVVVVVVEVLRGRRRGRAGGRRRGGRRDRGRRRGRRWSVAPSSATVAAAASADSPSEPPHPARTIDASAVVDVSTAVAVRLHARRRSWPFTAIGAVILRRRRCASAGRRPFVPPGARRPGSRSRGSSAPATTRLGGSADSTAPTRSRWWGRYCGNASRHLEIRTADGCRSIAEVAADLVDGRRHDRVVVEMVDAEPVAPERHAQDLAAVGGSPVRPFLGAERRRRHEALHRLGDEVAAQPAQTFRPPRSRDRQRHDDHVGVFDAAEQARCLGCRGRRAAARSPGPVTSGRSRRNAHRRPPTWRRPGRCWRPGSTCGSRLHRPARSRPRRRRGRRRRTSERRRSGPAPPGCSLGPASAGR